MATVEIKKPILAPPLPPSGETQLRCLQPAGVVGFHSLPDQLVKKCIQNGFTFNLLCVGETGIGKSTLLESLFNMSLKLPPCNAQLQTMKLDQASFDLMESGIRVKLSLTETAGFGDQLDKEKSAQKLVDFLESQFESWLHEELKIKRSLHAASDRRIHACIYCISFTGHGLKALDVCVLKAIAPLVNVIPVVAKADTISKEELKNFKEKILAEFRSNKIDIYYFPTDDPKEADINARLNAALPFAVIGSTDFEKVNGKPVRVRKYPWGSVEVENPEHCDFVALREALLRENVEHLRERTRRVLYEQYRRRRLQQLNIRDGDLGVRMALTFTQKRQQQQHEMRRNDENMQTKFKEICDRAEEDKVKRQKELEEKLNSQKQHFEKEWSKLSEEAQLIENEAKEFDKVKLSITQTMQRKHKK